MVISLKKFILVLYPSKTKEKEMHFLRPADERGHTQTEWFDSYHSFSFGNYYDPQFMGFSDLRVINDDIVEPGRGFEMHPHNNMEIITVVLSGALKHKDSLGSGSVIRPGEIQKMTAGSGILHSEFNPSATEPSHFLQIWLMPDLRDLRPDYEQKNFSEPELKNRLCLIVSPDKENNSIQIHQDARIWQSLLDEKQSVSYKISADRTVWLQIASGSVALNNKPLVAGDGYAIWDENTEIQIHGIDRQSNILLFDLNK